MSRLEGAGDVRPESGLRKLNPSDTAVAEWAYRAEDDGLPLQQRDGSHRQEAARHRQASKHTTSQWR